MISKFIFAMIVFLAYVGFAFYYIGKIEKAGQTQKSAPHKEKTAASRLQVVHTEEHTAETRESSAVSFSEDSTSAEESEDEEDSASVRFIHAA